MGHLFRSERMSLCQLFLQSESAYNSVTELGELGLLQFIDLNPDVNAFQRKFVNEVRRCDEMERKLRYLEKEIKRDEIPMLDLGDNPEAPPPREMIELEATFEKLENELKEVNTNSEALKKSYLELTELRHILKRTQQFFDEMHESGLGDESTQLLSDEGIRAGGQQPNRLAFVAGVISRERLMAFERMLWRVCKGNVFMKQADIEDSLEDPHTGDNVYKSVFIIFFQGDQLKTRVKKICEGFRASLYPCPETAAERREMTSGVVTRIEDLRTVLRQTTEHRHRVLVAAAKNIRTWFVKVIKIKAVYHALNMCNLDVTQKCLIAECWCAVEDLDKVQRALQRGTERSGSAVPSILNKMETKQTPPTFNRVNKFTKGFQGIVNSYGVARYREVNPALFTVITFPFLFAVMFGDAGHGVIMTLFALWLIIKEKSIGAIKNKNEIFDHFYGGRYIIFLMGLFSIYTGFLYNDIFSKSMNIFGSSWNVKNLTTDAKGLYEGTVILDPAHSYYGKPYPFGIDPVWQVASNKINFLNSFKMKLSVILGVAQMLFGVSLSLWNNMYFKNSVNIMCEFIPQVIFLLAIFGYMNLLILAKWIAYGVADAGCAPNILITLINMFLMKSFQKEPCNLDEMYNGQQTLQTILLVIALLCVPWMLIFKPYILKKNNDKKLALSYSEIGGGGGRSGSTGQNGTAVDGTATAGDQVSVEIDSVQPKPKANNDTQGGDGHGPGGEFDMGTVVIDQVIHTIEYCLGSISHTASYLRLWALSLAHAQLSEVLWTMVMANALASKGFVGAIMMYVIFMGWAVLTVAVLLIMEGLSAFLHALRLHWVEFQSKFYSGSGYGFLPFSFETVLNAEENEAQ